MLKIAVTGGIACGKSLTGAMLADLGMDVREADDIARELMRPGADVYMQVISEFGLEMTDGDGKIDRRKLADVIFSSSQDRTRLNRIVHPAVMNTLDLWLQAEEMSTCVEGAVAVVPLLYEAGGGRGWDAVICVASERSSQISRLAGRGLCYEDAVRRIDAQMDVEEKAVRSDYVIRNEGDKESLRKQINRVMRNIRRQKYGSKK
ncbi:MAG: dephospho-CoA kinase [Verrucomicrobiota bacterium]